MDGASKFIRGDAIAGLIITAINLIGGFVMGTMRGMSAGDSIKTYAILSVGDGLVSQIPALIIATSAGFLISKTSSTGNVSQDLVRQLFAKSRPLWIASFILGSMVFVPGLPKVPFVTLALICGLVARSLGRSEQDRIKRKKGAKAEESGEPAADQDHRPAAQEQPVASHRPPSQEVRREARDHPADGPPAGQRPTGRQRLRDPPE